MGTFRCDRGAYRGANRRRRRGRTDRSRGPFDIGGNDFTITGVGDPHPVVVELSADFLVAGSPGLVGLWSAAMTPAVPDTSNPGGVGRGEPSTGRLQAVLASASPARLSVLQAAGIDPVVLVSGVDEPSIEAANAHLVPAGTVTALARAKADAVLTTVCTRHPNSVVIGCDSMLLMNGRLRGKPVDAAQARRDWLEMSGGTGDLLTGHAVVVVRGGEIVARAADWASTTIRFGTPTESEIDAYLATGEPLLVAGGLTIDGYGGWFVDGLDGDHSSVIGISLPLTRRLLRRVGISVVDLWREN